MAIAGLVEVPLLLEILPRRMILVLGIFLLGMGISSLGIHLISSGKLTIAYLETFLEMEIDGQGISYPGLEISLKMKVTYVPKTNFPNVFAMKAASLHLFLVTKIEMKKKIR